MKLFQKKFIKSTVSDSIKILFNQAEDNLTKHPERSKRYIKMIWGLVKKHKVRLNEEQKLKFCRKCLLPWTPGKTMKILFDHKRTVFEANCLGCGYKRRC